MKSEIPACSLNIGKCATILAKGEFLGIITISVRKPRRIDY